MKALQWLCVSILFSVLTTTILAVGPLAESTEDNDFAEFEDIDEEDVTRGSSSGMEQDEDDNPSPKVVMAPEAAAAAARDSESSDEEEVTVEDDEDDDFEHLNDEDEFEGFDKERTPKKSQEQPPDLKITKIPIHLHTNWDSFYMEMLMLGGLAAYLLNFLAGKSKNHKMAQSWLATHRQMLEENFSVIGDDGTTPEAQSGVLMKEAENVYALWCSGRMYCEGMLVTLKLLKRQDLVSTIARLVRPANDQIIVKVVLDDSEFESFVFCLANKRVCSNLHKEHPDLSSYCSEKKNGEKFNLSSNFQILSESIEVTNYVLDLRVVAAINEMEPMIEYIHFSDQYSGPRQPDDTQPGKIPETKRVLIFCFNIVDVNGSLKDMEKMKPLMKMVFYCIERMKRMKLTKEAKIKAERNRQKTLETLQKAAHSQRTEAAQTRREEKRRAEKEKIMNEDDPQKQRKLEEKSLKKEAKKSQPKLKKMKIKAL